MLPIVLLFVAVGVFFIVAAVQNWDWFYLNRWFAEENIIARMFGEDAARWLVGVTGLSIVVGALWWYFVHKP
jgi:hypothetical protein